VHPNVEYGIIEHVRGGCNAAHNISRDNIISSIPCGRRGSDCRLLLRVATSDRLNTKPPDVEHGLQSNPTPCDDTTFPCLAANTKIT